MQSGTSHLEGALGELSGLSQADARLALQGLQHSAHNSRPTMRVQLHHILACTQLWALNRFFKQSSGNA